MANIKVDTRFGELSIDPAQVITFPKGVPGFGNNTQWILFHEVDDQGKCVNGVVMHLQSVDDGNVSLPLTDPGLFGFNYQLALSDAETKDLEIDNPDDVLVFTTLSVKDGAGTDQPPSMADLYANISAPILINSKTRRGMQKIIVGRDAKVTIAAGV